MRPKRSNDPVKAAHELFLEIIGEAPPPEPEPEKNPAAVERGKLGGVKGGAARAAKMTPEERAASARKAAEARWKRR
jgi:hypothetical protein